MSSFALLKGAGDRNHQELCLCIECWREHNQNLPLQGTKPRSAEGAAARVHPHTEQEAAGLRDR